MIVILFLGNTFLGSKYSADYTITSINNISYIELFNAVFDEVFVSNNIDADLINKVWDFYTIIWAKFQNSLSAGNVEFMLSQIDTIFIKRRKQNEFDWITLFEIPIATLDDLRFERFDKYNKGGVIYEYAFVPSLAGIEGNYNVNSIKSHFDGMFISEKDKTFGTILEYKIDRIRNISNSVVETIDSKYPFIINHSKNNYDSLNATGCFIEIDHDTCELKLLEGYDYRDNLMNFLGNGKEKILKLEDGRMWIVGITGRPSEVQEIYTDKFTTTFDCAEIGDAENMFDLYDANLIDIDISKVIRRI